MRQLQREKQRQEHRNRRVILDIEERIKKQEMLEYHEEQVRHLKASLAQGGQLDHNSDADSHTMDVYVLFLQQLTDPDKPIAMGNNIPTKINSRKAHHMLKAEDEDTAAGDDMVEVKDEA